MVGFSLGEILGQSVDTAQERADRLQASFDAVIEAFSELRLNDAYGHLDDMRAEIYALEVLLEIHGIKINESEGS